MQAVSLFQQARTAAKAGQKQQAHQLLQQAVHHDPSNHLIWLWLAKTSPSPQSSLEYVAQAEQLRPEDDLVRKARAWAERRMSAAAGRAAFDPALAASPTPAGRDNPRKRWRSGLLLLSALLLLAGLAALWGFLRPLVSPRAALEPATGLIATDEPPQVRLAAVPPAAAPTASSTPLPTSPPLLAKKVSRQSEDSRPTWTATPSPTHTPTPTPTPLPTFISYPWQKPEGRPLGVGPEERWIDVDLSEQTLYAYEGNSLIFETLISSGLPEHETVTGQFRIWYLTASQTMDGSRLGYDYYLENVPYVMYFFEDYALHGTYWHNNFGRPMSHGCVNMRTEDAAWVFEWARVGTVVNVHE